MCSSRILVAPSAGNFQTAIFKFEVLLSIFCGTKITLEWTTPAPPRILDGERGVQTMGANTYLYGCVSLLASKCAVSLFVCGCVLSN